MDLKTLIQATEIKRLEYEAYRAALASVTGDMYVISHEDSWEYANSWEAVEYHNELVHFATITGDVKKGNVNITFTNNPLVRNAQ